MTKTDNGSVRMPNGKYVDQLITHVPPGYLRWMVRADHVMAREAEAELERRGTPATAEDIEVSAHALDRASIRHLETYLSDRQEDEGLHAWLLRRGSEAAKSPARTADADASTHHYMRVVWVFGHGCIIPVLKTVL
jgi:hypothetical protein